MYRLLIIFALLFVGCATETKEMCLNDNDCRNGYVCNRYFNMCELEEFDAGNLNDNDSAFDLISDSSFRRNDAELGEDDALSPGVDATLLSDSGVDSGPETNFVVRRIESSDMIRLRGISYSPRFTAEAWVNFDTNEFAEPAQAVFASCSPGHRCFGAQLYRETLECFFGTGEGFSRVSISRESVVPNSWIHVSCEFDGTFARIYIDGRMRAERITPYAPPNDGEDIMLAYGAFLGSIDELHIMSGAIHGGLDFTPELSYTHDLDVLAVHMNEGSGVSLNGIGGWTEGSASYIWRLR